MRVGFVVAAITLLALVSCVQEQLAVPIEGSVELAQETSAQKNTTVPTKPVDKTTTADKTETPPATVTSEPTVPAKVVLDFVCLETDGGNQEDVKGSLQYKLPNSTIILKTDECLGESLREWYCDKGELTKEIYECKNGCVDGACRDS